MDSSQDCGVNDALGCWPETRRAAERTESVKEETTGFPMVMANFLYISLNTRQWMQLGGEKDTQCLLSSLVRILYRWYFILSS